MPCCGGKREQIHRSIADNSSSAPIQNGSRNRVVAAEPVYFEYTGTTGLTVQGPFTRKRYRFEGHGSRAEVDGRDASSLVAIPHVKRLDQD